jgi:hypothetical protein
MQATCRAETVLQLAVGLKGTAEVHHRIQAGHALGVAGGVMVSRGKAAALSKGNASAAALPFICWLLIRQQIAESGSDLV